MRKLLSITSRALSNLENLEELFCYDNPELSHIDKDALSARRDGAEYETWPPIKKVDKLNLPQKLKIQFCVLALFARKQIIAH